MTIKNVSAKKSVVLREAFLNGEKVDDKKVGKEKSRTTIVSVKKDKKNTEINSDLAEIIMDTENMDELVLTVTHGEVEISVEEEVEKMKKPLTDDLPDVPENVPQDTKPE